MDDQDFAEFVRVQIIRNRADRVARWERLYSASQQTASSAWKDIARRAIDTLTSSLIAADLHVPYDFPKEDSLRTMHRVRKAILNYGLLLQAWPELMRAAARVRSNHNMFSQAKAQF